MNSALPKGIYLHVISWCAYFVLLLFWFAIPFTYETAAWHAGRMLIIHIIIFYINTRVLLPLLIQRNSWGYYLLGITLLMIVVYYIFTVTNQFLPINRLEGVQMRVPRTFRSSRWIVQNMSLSFGVLFFSALQFLMDESRKRKDMDAQRIQEKLVTEMKLLRSQINPHFLFNALNNLYAMAISHQEKTPDLILKLSEMLRYVLYESNTDLVPAEKEWEYILNFVQLQELKFEDEVNLRVEGEIDPGSQIAPMILLPFVENAFKHSHIEDDGNGWIEISLKIQHGMLDFKVSNSNPGKLISKDNEGGIGMINVKKRLELLYPDCHKLIIEKPEGKFRIHLHIDLP
ncbi:sensor histidine kinase [Fulvivirga sedimenti]|uniref:Histidine kinase n=1 Tax=Fulvivirga sedimenti TaxID=2879465 RepID=A0A9X1HP42_9BACT|nr:histidine kinase [Fulvivirga sedimenti]MCA6074575.1 histidine kinase [Fulvivirga sedimenti]MCA6075752.1 histidine kinase [Fulvivirga sedimenti]MCA6076880.1 histidine kinase [Fulvivirga sedimenti]